MLRIVLAYFEARCKRATRTNGAVLIPIQPVVRTDNLSFILKCGQ
jgi:hypothetical protein